MQINILDYCQLGQYTTVIIKWLDRCVIAISSMIGSTMNITAHDAVQRAVNAHEAGEINEAIKLYNEILHDTPDHIIANHNMGKIAVDLGRFDTAIQYFKTALEANPTNSFELYFLIGVLHGKLGNFDGAIEAYTKAVAIRPDYAAAYRKLGEAFIRQSKFEKALEAYRNAAAITPDIASLQNNLGAMLHRQGKFEEAIQAYTRAVEIQPHYAEAHNNMGNVLYDQNNLDQAAKSYANAIDINPDYMEACRSLASVFRDQNKIEQAIEYYMKVMDIDNNDELSHELSAYCIRSYLSQKWLGKIDEISSIEKLIYTEKLKLKAKISEIPYWFVDIPRTSSTTIKVSMGKHFGWPFGKNNDFSASKKPIETSILLIDHTPAFLAKMLIGEDLWNSINTFTVVRNPYQWSVSLWKYTLKYNNLGLANATFEQFLKSISENFARDISSRRIYPSSYMQSDYLLDISGEKIVKNIMKYENKELKEFLYSIGIYDYEDIKLVQTGSSEYRLDLYERKAVERTFEKDFDLLGY